MATPASVPQVMRETTAKLTQMNVQVGPVRMAGHARMKSVATPVSVLLAMRVTTARLVCFFFTMTWFLFLDKSTLKRIVFKWSCYIFLNFNIIADGFCLNAIKLGRDMKYAEFCGKITFIKNL